MVRLAAVARPRAQIHQAIGWSARGTRRLPARLQPIGRTDTVSRSGACARRPARRAGQDGHRCSTEEEGNR